MPWVMTGAESAAMNEAIIALAVKGASIKGIASALQVPEGKIRNRVSRLVRADRIPRAGDRKGRRRPDNTIYETYGAQMGSIRDMLKLLTSKELHALGRQIPAGMTVAEYTAAIVKDALADEMGNGK